MYDSATAEDYKRAFYCRFSPSFASQLVAIIDRSSADARTLCEREFRSGAYGVAQGVNRWQYIDDRCRTEQFDGGVIAEPREFRKGKLLLGDEAVNSFTLLRSNEVGLVISKVDAFNPIPKKSLVKRYMASLPFASRPLFQDMGFEENLPDDLKILYVARYFLDVEDRENVTVNDIDVVLLTSDCGSIFCDICDLRTYAQQAVVTPYIYDEPLPMAFRPSEPTVEDDIDITIRDDLKKN